MKKDIKITWFLWSVVLLFDQITKYIIRKKLNLGDSISVIHNIFHITHINNTGAAFGMFPNAQIFFIVTSIIAIIALIYFLYTFKKGNPTFYISIGLILGGATGNLLDRLILRTVTDFLDFGINPKIRWPAFNIADSSVVIGFFILAILVIKGEFYKVNRNRS
ncbi:Lipoprotein signal peptidase [subsurface metagenome]